jgi:hypothetical protein
LVNAAILCAETARYREAVDRIDRFLNTSASSAKSIDDQIELMASQISWCQQMGNIDEAASRCRTLWGRHKHRDNLTVIQMGITLARWQAVPIRCEERLAILREVIERIARLRANVPPASPDAQRIADLERDALCGVADSEGCGDEEFVNWARGRLHPSP